MIKMVEEEDTGAGAATMLMEAGDQHLAEDMGNPEA